MYCVHCFYVVCVCFFVGCYFCAQNLRLVNDGSHKRGSSLGSSLLLGRAGRRHDHERRKHERALVRRGIRENHSVGVLGRVVEPRDLIGLLRPEILHRELGVQVLGDGGRAQRRALEGELTEQTVDSLGRGNFALRQVAETSVELEGHDEGSKRSTVLVGADVSHGNLLRLNADSSGNIKLESLNILGDEGLDHADVSAETHLSGLGFLLGGRQLLLDVPHDGLGAVDACEDRKVAPNVRGIHSAVAELGSNVESVRSVLIVKAVELVNAKHNVNARVDLLDSESTTRELQALAKLQEQLLLKLLRGLGPIAVGEVDAKVHKCVSASAGNARSRLGLGASLANTMRLLRLGLGLDLGSGASQRTELALRRLGLRSGSRDKRRAVSSSCIGSNGGVTDNSGVGSGSRCDNGVVVIHLNEGIRKLGILDSQAKATLSARRHSQGHKHKQCKKQFRHLEWEEQGW